MEVLKCENLAKKIDGKYIVKDITFSINKGDVVGLIGPNGAGKTTTMKLILGLIKITEGKVYINNFSITNDFTKAIEKVGAIIENPDHYMYLSGYDNLKITARNYKNISQNKINEVIKLVGLENRIKDKVSTYSLGMKQRLGIAEALINDPELLILDEPTNGLDVDGIIEMRKLIKQLANNGISILISSHNLTEIDNLCNRIIAIKNGRIIEDDTISAFHSISDKASYILELNTTSNIENLINYENEILTENKVRIYVSKDQITEVLQKLIESKYKIYSCAQEKFTSEEAFIKKVGENKID